MRLVSVFQLFLFILLIGTSSSTAHNDATESFNTQPVHGMQDEQGSEATNKARNGGRGLADNVRNGESKQLCVRWFQYTFLIRLYVVSCSLAVSC